MSSRKKIALWVIGIIGALLAFLLIFILLLPTLINLEPIREKIAATISEEMGGELEFQRIDLSFFPRPRVMIYQGSLSIPGKVAGTLGSSRIYPEILPLLRGRVRIAMLHVEAPNVKIVLPERPQSEKGRSKALSFATTKEKVAATFALIASKAPNLTLVVEGGRLDIIEGHTSVFWFRDIDARVSFPPDKLEIDLTCNSNLWESISFEGWLHPESFKGAGRIDVTRFQLQRLIDHFLPFATGRVGDSFANFTISFETDGFKTLQAEVQSSLPSLTLEHAKQKLVIRGKSLKGTFHMDEGRITVSLSELDLDYPQLSMSGILRIDQTSPRVSLELEGREVDVHSAREATLAMAGDIPIIQEIFDILKEGKIPLIRVTAQGSSLAELEKAENIFIKGNIVEGKIYVPRANLDLGDVKGEVVISQGIL